MKRGMTVKRLIAMLLSLCLLLTGCGLFAEEALTWEDYCELGVRYLSEGNYEEAILAFEAAIEIDPKAPQAYTGLAEVYMELERYETAEDILEEGFEKADQTQELEELLEEIEQILTPSEPENEAETQVEPEEEKVPEPEPEIVENIGVLDVPYTGISYYNDVTSIAVERQVEVDLDGCGQNEIVALIGLYEGQNKFSNAIRVVKGKQVADSVSIGWGADFLIEDLNSDGLPELLASADMASSDYAAYGWNLINGALVPVGSEEDGVIGYGKLISVDDGVVTLESYRHVLGTWFVWQKYILGSDGLETMPGTIWEMRDTGEYGMKVIADLPVTINGEETTLPPGTAMELTGFDGENTAWFATSTGVTGTIEVQQVEDFDTFEKFAMWSIDGRPEYDFFEALFYAG